MTNSITPSTPGNERLTERQAAAELGLNLGQLIQLRANGARLFDPSFPRMLPDRTFVESEILAYKKLRDSRAAASSTPTAPPPVVTNDQRDRRAAADRRTTHV
jgi:uncharacterized protein (DUF1800 family)